MHPYIIMAGFVIQTSNWKNSIIFIAYGTVQTTHLQQFTEKEKFDFFKDADSVEFFKNSHPEVMKKRIAEKNWQIQFDTNKKKMPFKKRILYYFEKLTGRRFFSYKNYKTT